MADAVAEISGKAAGAVEDMVAVVHCSRVQGKVHTKYNYIGYGTCTGANIAFAGPLDCQYGCVGFGECAEACPFDAITMIDNFPVVDPDLCVACGNCVNTCPKGVIQLIPKGARVFIPCNTKDTAKATMLVCSAGCIHCKACIRKCPAKAISEIDGVVTVDHKICMDYGPDCEEVCISSCKKVHVLQRFELDQEKRLKEAVAA